MTSPPVPRLFTFAGGSSETWQVEQTRPVVGESLPAPAALRVVAAGVGAAGAGDATSGGDAVWRLRGIVSNERYVERAEARRLHHCRDLSPDEPFDFLTWFEYTPADAGTFEDLVGTLRDSPEWRFVDREVDIRLSR
jgi:hypothetical protein